VKDGANTTEAKSFSSGPNGAIQSAKPPARANTTTIAKPKAPSGLRRQKASARPSSEPLPHRASVSASSGREGVTAVMGSRIADTRGEPGIKHVDHEVGEHEDNDEQHDKGMGEHIDMVMHGLHEQPGN